MKGWTMRKLRGEDFDRFRIPVTDQYLRVTGLQEKDRWGDDYNGAFWFPSPIHNNDPIRVMAGCGLGWDHVSASLVDRCPLWGEMEWIKRRFFLTNETAMQLHVPPDKHVNFHPFTLHLWRPHKLKIPLPPEFMV